MGGLEPLARRVDQRDRADRAIAGQRDGRGQGMVGEFLDCHTSLQQVGLVHARCGEHLDDAGLTRLRQAVLQGVPDLLSEEVPDDDDAGRL